MEIVKHLLDTHHRRINVVAILNCTSDLCIACCIDIGCKSRKWRGLHIHPWIFLCVGIFICVPVFCIRALQIVIIKAGFAICCRHIGCRFLHNSVHLHFIIFLCHVTGRNCILSSNCYVCLSCLRFICFFFVSTSTYNHRHTDA